MQINNIRIGFFISLALFMQLISFGQNSDDTNVSTIINKIPPLHILIDSAIINSPYIKFQNAEIMKNHFKIRTAKTNWTRNLGISGDVVYGTYDYLSWNPNTGTTTINNQTETRYGTGVFIRLPLYEALNRKNEVGIAELDLQESKYLKEQKIQELRQLVITQYNTVVLNERLLNILNGNQQSTALQVQMVEKQFTNGQATVEELARLTEIHNNAVVSYEKARIELTVSYLILQELVGIKFNLN